MVPHAHDTDIRTVLQPRANLWPRGTSRQTCPTRRRISRASEPNPGGAGGTLVMDVPEGRRRRPLQDTINRFPPRGEGRGATVVWTPPAAGPFEGYPCSRRRLRR